jgi:hypothetical protein
LGAGRRSPGEDQEREVEHDQITGDRIWLWFEWKGRTSMARQGRQTARKPATKFAHLRKKMEKTRIVSKISKKKK